MITYLPKSLKKNSTIGLICPAGGLESNKPVKLAGDYLKKGAEVAVEGKLIYRNYEDRMAKRKASYLWFVFCYSHS